MIKEDDQMDDFQHTFLYDLFHFQVHPQYLQKLQYEFNLMSNKLFYFIVKLFLMSFYQLSLKCIFIFI